MGLIRNQSIGEGMEIVGKGEHIEVKVLEIKGYAENKTVKFGLRGVKGINVLELSAQDNYYNLTLEIKIRVCIRDRVNVTGRPIFYGEHPKSKYAYIDYDAPKRDYHMNRLEF